MQQPINSFFFIFQRFGKGLGGSALAFAHYVTWHTKCFVYGGFIRDFVMRGDAHAEMDLDIGFDSGDIMNPSQALRATQAWANGHNMKLKVQNLKGRDVLEVTFSCMDERSNFCVEFVNAGKFAQRDSRVDFDVNNLKVKRSGNTASIGFKYENEADKCGTVEEVKENCRRKRLKVLKNFQEVSSRIHKMASRRWTILDSNGNPCS